MDKINIFSWIIVLLSILTIIFSFICKFTKIIYKKDTHENEETANWASFISLLVGYLSLIISSSGISMSKFKTKQE